MKKILSMSAEYVIIAIIFWLIFSIGNTNFIIFEWSYEARTGYAIILAFLLFVILIGYSLPDND